MVVWQRLVCGLLISALLLCGAPRSTHAAVCPTCICPPGDDCLEGCSDCGTDTNICTCDLFCSTSGCPAGFQEFFRSSCGFSPEKRAAHVMSLGGDPLSSEPLDQNRRGFEVLGEGWDFVCAQDCPPVPNGECNSCFLGYYGGDCSSECLPSANNPCNGNGNCADGTSGNGECTCFPTFAGDACEFSDAITCSGHGLVNDLGLCTCNSGWDSSNPVPGAVQCDVCAVDFYGPECVFCHRDSTCSSHGDCDALGGCACDNGFDGQSCSLCAEDHYDHPNCAWCDEQIHCNNVGLCDQSGLCDCTFGFVGTNCTQCDSHRYGQNCDLCPGGSPPCNDAGSCNDGINGNGKCVCDPGHAGTTCQYSDAVTCNGHGTALSNGQCDCDEGWAGSRCTTCANFYFGVNCDVYCHNSQTCGQYGSCDPQGDCLCLPLITGPQCDTCIVDRYDFPTCRYCLASSTCSGNGVCSELGYCDCDEGYTGSSCNTCANGYWGANCDMCPGAPGLPCYGYGTCDDGPSGNGECDCDEPYFGDDCNDISLNSVIPTQLPTKGGSVVIFEGTGFDLDPGALSVKFLTSPPVFCGDIDVQGNFLTCTAPDIVGNASGLLHVVASKVGKDSLPFTIEVEPAEVFYAQPSLQTTNFLRVGGERVTIVGRNFGANPTLHYGYTSQPALPVVLATHDKVVFDTPPMMHRLRFHVGVNGQFVATNFQVRLSTPVVTSVTLFNEWGQEITDIPTNTSGYVELVGSNFGLHIDDVPVNQRPTGSMLSSFRVWSMLRVGAGPFGPEHDALVQSDVFLRIPLPHGEAVMNLFVYGGWRFFDSFPVTFEGPVVQSVSGCTDQGDRTRNCDPAGGTKIFINGYNMGLDADGYLGGAVTEVRVGGAVCENVNVSVPHTQLSCDLPSGAGNSTVSVRKGNFISLGGVEMVEYRAPTIFRGTLKVEGGSVVLDENGVAYVFVNATDGDNMRVNFLGVALGVNTTGFGPEGTPVSVTYGPNNDLEMYTCDNVVISAAEDEVSCDLVAGVGTQLHFQVKVGSALVSTQVDDYIQFAPPKLSTGTLRFAGEPLASGTHNLTGETTEGELIQFDGFNFGQDVSTTTVDVLYGTRPCVVSAASSSDSVIVCQTIAGDGVDFKLSVSVGHFFSPESVQTYYSNDTYSYPQSPELYSVEGCTTEGDAAVDCPTDARNADGSAVTLTIHGRYFRDFPIVQIGTDACQNVRNDETDPTRKLYCELPPSAGLNRPVVVKQAQFFSRSLDLVSYAPPVVTHIEGCAELEGNSTVECPREGGLRITLFGRNFGDNGHTIVAGLPCVDTIHDPSDPHHNVSCVLPAGVVLRASVIFFQEAGEASTDAPYISYAQCPPGQQLSGLTCSDCEPGYSNALIGQQICFQCPSGSYSEAGAVECTLCPPGSAQFFSSQSECPLCPVGRFSELEGSPECQDCALGKFTALEGSTVCAPCPAGRFQQELGQSFCHACDAGSITSTTGQLKCEKCPLGTIRASPGGKACTSCPVGRFSNTGSTKGATACVQCAPGSFAPSRGNHACTECSAGLVTETAGQSECTACSPGKIAAQAGQSVCSDCPARTANSALGSVVCVECQVGTFAASPGHATCTFCPLGKYQPNNGQSECLDCPLGTFTSNLKSPECQACPHGQFANVTGQEFCYKCPPGFFSQQGTSGASACTICSPGEHSLVAGSEKCDLCQEGTYAPVAGMVSCRECEAGWYGPASGLYNCSRCEPGRFSQGGFDDCTDCEPGKFASSFNQTECGLCSVGTFQLGSGSSECLDCTSGKHTNKLGARLCDPCGPGKYSNVSGQSECYNCRAGSFSASGASVCQDCAAGRYTSTKGEAACRPCERGTSGNLTGMNLCPQCTPGRFQDKEEQLQCVGCQLGRFVESPGRQQCNECPIGTFANVTSRSVCSDCPLGKYALRGATVCEVCIPGTFNAFARRSTCSACAAGSFNTESGLADCTSCPDGEHQGALGATTCHQCPAGKISYRVPSIDCRDCAAGSYQGLDGQTTCAVCEEGKFMDRVGATVCQNCTVGRFSAVLAAESCGECPAGRAQNLTGQDTCILCQPGTFQSISNQANCDQCPPGRFINQIGAQDCLNCPAGSFNPDPGQHACVVCPVGHFQSISGQTACDPCLTGFFQPNQNSRSCIPCTNGTYQDVEGQVSCKSCPLGRAQSAEGSGECVECSPGYKGDSENLVECTPCEKGFFQELSGLAVCDHCPVGRFQNQKGRSACVDCAVGKFASETQQTTCRDCAKAFFANETGQEACRPCPQAYYQASEGQTMCRQCPAGRFNADMTSTFCTDCDRGKYSAENATTACTVCAAGKAQSARNSRFCGDCPAGKFSPQNAIDCTQCPARSAAPSAGASSCLACPPNAIENIDSTGCICESGFFQLPITNQTRNMIDCGACPDGAICDRRGLTYDTLRTRDGHWRSSPESLLFYRCLLPTHCAVGIGPACEGNRDGPLCAVCREGYRSQTGVSECEKCPSDDTGWGVTVLLFILLVLLVILVYYLVLRSDRNLIMLVERLDKRRLHWDRYDIMLGAERVEAHVTARHRARLAREREKDAARARLDAHFAKIGDLGLMDVSSDELLSDEDRGQVVVDDVDVRALEEEEERANHQYGGEGRDDVDFGSGKFVYKRGRSEYDYEDYIGVGEIQKDVRSRYAPSIMFKLKICVGFLQILTNMAFVLDAEWPKTYQRFIAFFQFLNLDLLPWQSMGCVTGVTFWGRYVIVIIAPVVVLALLTACYLGPAYLMDRRRSRDAQGRTDRDALRMAQKRTRRKYWKLVLFTLFLLYPNVAKSVLSLFICREIDGVNYLVANFSELCLDYKWWSYVPLGLCATFLYVLGIPGFFFYLLMRYFHRFGEPAVRLELGFLYAAYNNSSWWFELADMSNKLVMSSLVAFFPLDYQMPAAMLWTAGFVVVLMLWYPYVRRGEDVLHFLVEVELYLITLVVYIFVRHNLTMDDATDMLLSILFIAMVLGIVVFFTYLFVINVRKLFRSSSTWDMLKRYFCHDELDRKDRMEREKRRQSLRPKTQRKEDGVWRDATSSEDEGKDAEEDGSADDTDIDVEMDPEAAKYDAAEPQRGRTGTLLGFVSGLIGRGKKPARRPTVSNPMHVVTLNDGAHEGGKAGAGTSAAEAKGDKYRVDQAEEDEESSDFDSEFTDEYVDEDGQVVDAVVAKREGWLKRRRRLNEEERKRKRALRKKQRLEKLKKLKDAQDIRRMEDRNRMVNMMEKFGRGRGPSMLERSMRPSLTVPSQGPDILARKPSTIVTDAASLAGGGGSAISSLNVGAEKQITNPLWQGGAEGQNNDDDNSNNNNKNTSNNNNNGNNRSTQRAMLARLDEMADDESTASEGSEV